MKTIKDITQEQAIEISKLIHTHSEVDLVLEMNYDFKYEPFEPRLKENFYEEVDELVHLYFKANTFGNTIDRVRLTIYPNLDCHWGYLRDNGEHSLPTNNQRAIQRKFIEWDIHPISEHKEEKK